MGKTITLPDDVYARLEQQAAAQGLGVPELIARLECELENARMAAAIEAMRAEGVLLTRDQSAPSTRVEFKPVPVRGKPVSESIIEERR
jgi:hypothetical protein